VAKPFVAIDFRSLSLSDWLQENDPMSRPRIAHKLLPAAILVLISAVAVYAATVVLFVYPGNLEGWTIQTTPGPTPSPSATPGVKFVVGPTTPPRGQGSVELSVGSDGQASAQLRNPDFAGARLPNPDAEVPPATDELTTLVYSTYVQQAAGASVPAPYLVLTMDYNDDNVSDDTLIFQPRYQSSNFCRTDQGSPTTGVWQTWDALNGCWYSLNGTAGATPGTGVKPLRTISAAQPSARVVNAQGAGFRVVAGLEGAVWDNFIGNLDNLVITVGTDPEGDPNTKTFDFEASAPPVSTTGGVIISEFRSSGPGTFGGPGVQRTGRAVSKRSDIRPQGSFNPGATDEYVELYNTSDNDILVQSSDGTGGWAIVQSGATCADPPTVVAIIPEGTLIRGRGHYLLAGATYTLANYPGGAPDQPLAVDIGGSNSIGLFNSATTFFGETYIDSVGFLQNEGDQCDLLGEGTKLFPANDSHVEYAYVRKISKTSGLPQDTNDNSADFNLLSTMNQIIGANDPPVLGVPGPENSRAPLQANDKILPSLIAPGVGASESPNRVRVMTIEPCAEQGSLLIRRTFTNTTSQNITQLRFRVIEIDTFNTQGNSPGGNSATLRMRDALDETLNVPGRGTISVKGATIEQPPFQFAPTCGGLNTSLSSNTITPQSPLAPGASIDIVFRLGVVQQGSYRFFVNIEALTESQMQPTIAK